MLYRASQAEKVEDVKNLENYTWEGREILKSEGRAVDLYKMAGDLIMVFMNTADPFEDESTIGYKITQGNSTLLL